MSVSLGYGYILHTVYYTKGTMFMYVGRQCMFHTHDRLSKMSDLNEIFQLKHVRICRPWKENSYHGYGWMNVRWFVGLYWKAAGVMWAIGWSIKLKCQKWWLFTIRIPSVTMKFMIDLRNICRCIIGFHDCNTFATLKNDLLPSNYRFKSSILYTRFSTVRFFSVYVR